MTSTTDADDAPPRRRRTAAAPQPDAAPPPEPATPAARKRRVTVKADAAPPPSAPAAGPEPAPAPRVRRTRAKSEDGGAEATAAAPAASTAATPAASAATPPAAKAPTTRSRTPKAAEGTPPTLSPSSPTPSAPTPSALTPPATTPTHAVPGAADAPARRPRGRSAKTADGPPGAARAESAAASAPIAPPTAGTGDHRGSGERGPSERGAVERTGDGSAVPPLDRPLDGDTRREGFRSNRRRRRGRGDGTREPGGYSRGPVPPGGDVVRPRDPASDARPRDVQPPGGWRRDDAIRDTRRTDAGRVERRDDGSRYGGAPRDDRRSGGQTGGQPPGGQQGGSQQSGSSQGGSQQSGQRQGGQSQGDSRYGGGRPGQQGSGQQGGGQQGTGQTGGVRYDGGRAGGRPDGGRGSGRFEGRGRHNGPTRDRGRDAARPPAGPPEDWDAPVPGGLEAGGHAGADWVSYEDRIAGDETRRPTGQQVIGYIELSKNGNGILRAGGLAGRTDPVLPMRLLRQYGLRSGDLVDGLARGTQVVEVNQVNGHDPVDLAKRPHFDTLTAVHPDKALLLGATADNLTGRLLDLVAPVGRGQRGLIVAPPKAGKTTLLKDMANGLAHDPKLTLLICLVGERPEEVTDMRRSTNCTVLAADMDLPTEDHTRVAEICVEHAKRLVEEGKHVVILMDSLTRLARAYNLSIKGGGSRTLSGGMDAGALQPVRKFFGAARCAEGGGSLTILATCLVDTGSRLDDLVYEEFKGTGNMEVHLDRKLSELRLFPAVDIRRSGTRREELLFDAKMLEQVHTLRRQLAPLEPAAALTAMLDALRKQAMPDGSLAGR